jgi:hypothetical protein
MMTDQSLQEYLDLLGSKGWRVELWENAPPALGASFVGRYPRIPEDYVKFLQRVKSCVNADETVWFLCIDDYNNESDSAWAWNEMEKTALDGTVDEKERRAIIEFWNRHLPFMYSIGGEYGYLAFRVGVEPFGSVVEGYEDLSDASDSFASFDEFIGLHSAAVQGEFGDTTLFDYV